MVTLNFESNVAVAFCYVGDVLVSVRDKVEFVVENEDENEDEDEDEIEINPDSYRDEVEVEKGKLGKNEK